MAYNDPEYTHYVVANGKIESGWSYKEDAAEHKKESMHEKLRPIAKVVAKSALKRHGIDPDNDSHWMSGKMESVSFSKSIYDNNLHEAFTSAHKKMDEMVEYVIMNCQKKGIIGSRTINEMKDAPDNSIPALSKEEVRNLILKHVRLDEPNSNADSYEAKCPEGREKANIIDPNGALDSDDIGFPSHK